MRGSQPQHPLSLGSDGPVHAHILVPVIERRVPVNLRPQELTPDVVPVTAADGRGLAVDVQIRW